MQETQETQVQSSGGEDLLEEEMATCSNILAWKFQFSRGAWQHTVHTHTHTHLTEHTRLWEFQTSPRKGGRS